VLARTGRLAFGRYAALVDEAGSAVAVLRRERLLGAPQTSLFADPQAELERELIDASQEISGWRSQGLTVATVLDAEYPDSLRAAHDRPPLIFVAGRLKSRDDRAVAVIGSRAASADGVKAATATAEALVRASYTVVSGLAAGIDTAAHTAALRRGGRTIAVIGTGLAKCYPRQNVTLQRRIAAQCAVVSQFLPDTPPSQETFPQRNAVMSGLSLATVIIEASYRSGARIQARAALAQGRPVFLLESLMHQRWAQELAERPGVRVAGTPADVVGELERLYATSELVA
jgi:DNA processing protein